MWNFYLHVCCSKIQDTHVQMYLKCETPFLKSGPRSKSGTKLLIVVVVFFFSQITNHFIKNDTARLNPFNDVLNTIMPLFRGPLYYFTKQNWFTWPLKRLHILTKHLEEKCIGHQVYKMYLWEILVSVRYGWNTLKTLGHLHNAEQSYINDKIMGKNDRRDILLNFETSLI